MSGIYVYNRLIASKTKSTFFESFFYWRVGPNGSFGSEENILKNVDFSLWLGDNCASVTFFNYFKDLSKIIFLVCSIYLQQSELKFPIA